MLTLDEVKGFLRIDHNEEDGYISVLLLLAKELCENYMRKDIIEPMPESVRQAQLLSKKIKKGIDVRIQIISKIEDPDAYGSERLVIENAWFNELTLQKFENATMIDEEYSG